MTPRKIASELAMLVKWDGISVLEREDLEIVLRVPAENAYDAARSAIDRVQAATAEGSFVAPELLDVTVLCIYGGIDPEAEHH